MYATDSQTSAISRHGKKIMTGCGKSFAVNGLSKIFKNKTDDSIKLFGLENYRLTGTAHLLGPGF